MNYALFIDDERFPPEKTPDGCSAGWFIARTMEEAINIIQTLGSPLYVSFDHDLAQPSSGFDLAKWMVHDDLDHQRFPDGFTVTVHSQNPIGADNIFFLFDGYFRHYADGRTLSVIR